MKFENTDIWGFEHALRGMRNPKNSWDRSDSSWLSVDDPAFDRRMPHNSWGCNTQALTMLRALFWMKEYGREADLELFHRKWAEATVENDTLFQQELDPFTGKPILGSKDYTPTLLLLREYGKKHPELLR